MLLNKLKVLLSITDDSEDGLLELLLEQAMAIVLQAWHPYDDTQVEIPERYQRNVLDIAVYLYNKRGAEGQISHSENGISRSYESGSVPASLLQGIVPCVGVM